MIGSTNATFFDLERVYRNGPARDQHRLVPGRGNGETSMMSMDTTMPH
jgi:hypothetical protein